MQQLSIVSILDAIGVFVEVYRERFKEDTMNDPPLLWNWTEDPNSSGILIEAAPIDLAEVRNKRPGIAVSLGQAVQRKDSIGHHASDPRPTLGMRQYDCKIELDMVVSCLSSVYGESLVIGELCQDTIIPVKSEIERLSNLAEISDTILNKPRPHEEDREVWETTVEFRTSFRKMWATAPVGPVLQKIGLKIADAENPSAYFYEMFLRRRD